MSTCAVDADEFMRACAHVCARERVSDRMYTSYTGCRCLAGRGRKYIRPGTSALLKLAAAPSNQIAGVGETATFACKSYPRFEDTYYWMQFAKDPVFGHFITTNAPTRHDASRAGRYSVRSGSLTIKKVDITDGGRYRCIATQARLQWSAYLLVMSAYSRTKQRADKAG